MPICHVVVVMAGVFRRREIIVKVAVSACLLGIRCRFDGRSKPSAEVQCFLEGHECQVVKICPEVMGGLSIPHPPHEQRVLDGQVRWSTPKGTIIRKRSRRVLALLARWFVSRAAPMPS